VIGCENFSPRVPWIFSQTHLKEVDLTKIMGDS
jgi:hypothetical protein